MTSKVTRVTWLASASTIYYGKNNIYYYYAGYIYVLHGRNIYKDETTKTGSFWLENIQRELILKLRYIYDRNICVRNILLLLDRSFCVFHEVIMHGINYM